VLEHGRAPDAAELGPDEEVRAASRICRIVRSLVSVRFPRGDAMYTVIRRYQGVQDADEVVRRAVTEFAPTIRDQPGFQGYWVVNGGDGVVATITVFETEAAAAESTAAAGSWVQATIPNLVPNPPRVTAGETTGLAAEVPA
jgi:Antibiotic biosynthesis monooxygenase